MLEVEANRLTHKVGAAGCLAFAIAYPVQFIQSVRLIGRKADRETDFYLVLGHSCSFKWRSVSLRKLGVGRKRKYNRVRRSGALLPICVRICARIAPPFRIRCTSTVNLPKSRMTTSPLGCTSSL